MRYAEKMLPRPSSDVKQVAWWQGATLLHFAASHGDVAVLSLLTDLRADISAKNVQGDTALDIANRVYGGCAPAMIAELLMGTPDRKDVHPDNPCLDESTQYVQI